MLFSKSPNCIQFGHILLWCVLEFIQAAIITQKHAQMWNLCPKYPRAHKRIFGNILGFFHNTWSHWNCLTITWWLHYECSSNMSEILQAEKFCQKFDCKNLQNENCVSLMSVLIHWHVLIRLELLSIFLLISLLLVLVADVSMLLNNFCLLCSLNFLKKKTKSFLGPSNDFEWSERVWPKSFLDSPSSQLWVSFLVLFSFPPIRCRIVKSFSVEFSVFVL